MICAVTLPYITKQKWPPPITEHIKQTSFSNMNRNGRIDLQFVIHVYDSLKEQAGTFKQ